MIFVTVGGQLPFDRLIQRIDEWVAQSGRTDVFCQIGESDYEPLHVPFARFLPPAEFSARLQAASALIAHAGMGTIISALQLGKPILVFPRRAELGEQRNDHQLATAQAFAKNGLAHVAMDDEELHAALLGIDQLAPVTPIGPAASEPLLYTIRRFLEA